MEDIRNEVAIELAGETRTMRATFAAIRGIEKDLGMSIVAIISKVGTSGDISMTHLATVIYHGLRGNADTRLSLEQVGDAIMVSGMQAAAMPAVEFLSNALSGVSVGKSQPEAAKAPQ